MTGLPDELLESEEIERTRFPLWVKVLVIVLPIAIVLGFVALFVTRDDPVIAVEETHSSVSPSSASPSRVEDSPADPSASDDAAEAEAEAAAAAAAEAEASAGSVSEGADGTESTGAPVSSAVSAGAWTVEVVDYSADANSAVASDPQLPQVPAEGRVFIGVKIRFTNKGTAAAEPYLALGTYLKADNGEFVFGTVSFAADAVDAIGPLAPGESAEGWAYFNVPSTFQTGTLTLNETSSGNLTEITIP